MPESAPIRQEEVGWRERATCKDYPPDLWFARGGKERKLAKQLCLECEVLLQCTAYAVAGPVGSGITAAMTPNQLTKLKKQARDAA